MSPDGPLNLTVQVGAKSFGSQIHKLAARALIRDFEEGSSYLHANNSFVQESLVKYTLSIYVVLTHP